MTIDLDAVERRYMAALDAKPGKGPITRLDALTDCVADVGDLVDEVRELREQSGLTAPVTCRKCGTEPAYYADGIRCRCGDWRLSLVIPRPTPLDPRP